VFDINKKELSSRSIDYIDIVNDPINPNEYKEEEDPTKFRSSKTQRGPLNTNWIEELKANSNQPRATSILSSHPIKYMCAYKLCRIECAFWGCQSRVEKLISESVLRHMILMSHRQAWCWQDEYFDLSMDDVRQLEAETQKYLLMKMNNDPRADEYLRKSNSKLNINTSDTTSNRRKNSSAASSIKALSDERSHRGSILIKEEPNAILPLVNGKIKELNVHALKLIVKNDYSCLSFTYLP